MNFQSSPSRQRSITNPKTPTTPDIFHSNEYKPRLYDEVSIIMKAYGDALSGQQTASVILVEKIVIQQLRGILNEAINVAYKNRSTLVPSQLDFEFLFRRNTTKVQRFRKYMKSIYKLKAEQKQGYGINFLNKLAEDGASEDEEIYKYDEERTRRLFRADKISQILNQQKYEEFQKARSWSSNIRNKSEMQRKLAEILPITKEVQENSPESLEIIIYLAQETIATVVDYSILTRLNTDNHVTDPFTVSSNITNNMLHLCPEVTQGRGQDGIKPITVQEINEAMRRFSSISSRRMGTSFRSCEMKTPFLAL